VFEDERCCLPCEDVGSSSSVLHSGGGGSVLERKKVQEGLRSGPRDWYAAAKIPQICTCRPPRPEVGGSVLDPCCN